MNTWEVFLCDADGEPATPLPGVLELEFTDDSTEPGGGRLTYSKVGDYEESSNLLRAKAEICILIDGVHPTELNFELQDSTQAVLDPVTGSPTEVVWSYMSMRQRLEESKIFPVGDTAEDILLEGTALGIMHDLINTVQARTPNPLADMTHDFGPVNDSAGEPHDPDSFMSITAKVGWSLLDVVRMIEKDRLAEFRIRKHNIRGWNYDTLGTDHTLLDPPLILQAGRDIRSGQRDVDPRGLFNSILVIGDDDRFATSVDLDSVLDYKCRELVYNASGVSDQDVLDKIANTLRLKYRDPIAYKAYELILKRNEDKDAPHPYEAGDGYFKGDYVYVADDHSAEGLQRVRIPSINVKVDRSGIMSCRIAADTRRVTKDALRDYQLDQLQHGLPSVPPTRKKMPPAAPTSLTFTTDVEIPDKGPETAWLRPAWVAPTTDADGQPLYDFDEFEIRYRTGDEKWKVVTSDTDAFSKIRNLPLGTSYDVRVRAVDTAGNKSAALTGSFTTATGTGRYTATDDLGADLVKVTDTRYHLTKVQGGVLAATGPGIDIDSDRGVRLWDGVGTQAIDLNSTDGSGEFLGPLHVGGDFTADGVSTLKNETHIEDDCDIKGTLTVYSGASPVLVVDGSGMRLEGDLDAQGHEIAGGKFSTDNGIVLEGNTASFGANDMTFDITKITVSQGFRVTNALTVDGSTQTDGLDNNGNGSCNGSGTTLGFYGSAGATIQNVLVTGRTADQKVDDLINALDALHLITQS